MTKAFIRAAGTSHSPLHTHDCETCVLLGTTPRAGVDQDVYFCGDQSPEGSIVIRYGDDGPDYGSFPLGTARVLAEGTTGQWSAAVALYDEYAVAGRAEETVTPVEVVASWSDELVVGLYQDVRVERRGNRLFYADRAGNPLGMTVVRGEGDLVFYGSQPEGVQTAQWQGIACTGERMCLLLAMALAEAARDSGC